MKDICAQLEPAKSAQPLKWTTMEKQTIGFTVEILETFGKDNTYCYCVILIPLIVDIRPCSHRLSLLQVLVAFYFPESRLFDQCTYHDGS